jgi:putative tryptophan/tyrosine transport system substrate-binding protein
MQRRAFVAGVTALLMAARVGEAQQRSPGSLVRIGWLSGSPYAGSPLWAAFIGGLQERGWVEGRNFTIEPLYSEGRAERFVDLVAELVRRKVDLIIAEGTAPAAAAGQATSITPIVFFYVGDPVGSGLVASLAHPGANLTGTGGLGTWTAVKLLELLKEALPHASRVGVFVNSTIAQHRMFRDDLEPGARSLGVTLRFVEVRSPDDLDGAFTMMADHKIDALLILGQGMMFSHRVRVARQALEHRLPAIIPFGEVAEAGVLMSYGPRLIDDMRRLPRFVDRILKGAKPADLPVEQPMRFYLTINHKTAKALGLTIPAPLLARADQVIE